MANNNRLVRAQKRVVAEHKQVAKDVAKLETATDPELIARVTRDLAQKEARLAAALRQLANATKPK